MLSAFLKWLDENNVIDCRVITDKNDTGFDTRFRIQKCMYLAQYLGLGTDYNYKQFAHGPYSHDLTIKYYAYDPEAPIDEPLPPNFDRIGNVVLRAHAKGWSWMEVATTILEDARECRGAGRQYTRDQIERNVASLKYQYTDDYIHTVYGELLGTPLDRELPNAASSPVASQAT